MRGHFSTYLFGIAVGVVVTFAAQAMWPVLPSMTNFPKVTSTIMPAYPKEILIKFVDRRDFDHDRMSRMTAFANGMPGTKSLAAYALIRDNPCTIIMPSDFDIWLFPKTGQAFFDMRQTGDTLAHELAHCFYGGWHSTWDKIK